MKLSDIAYFVGQIFVAPSRGRGLKLGMLPEKLRNLASPLHGGVD